MKKAITLIIITSFCFISLTSHSALAPEKGITCFINDQINMENKDSQPTVFKAEEFSKGKWQLKASYSGITLSSTAGLNQANHLSIHLKTPEGYIANSSLPIDLESKWTLARVSLKTPNNYYFSYCVFEN